MNPNKQQALEQEQAGIDEVGEDIDYDSVYGGLDVEGLNTPKSKELKNSYSEIFKDVTKQGVKETLIGAGGAYGDLLDLIGLNSKEQLPAEKSRNSMQFDTLEKMNQPGYKPSFSDISSLSDDDVAPSFSGLPTSESLTEFNEMIGGPGKAETKAGQYAGRAGKLIGAGLAFGQLNPIAGIVGGAAGQATEDLGGGPLMQAAAEITGMVLTPQGGLKKLLTSNKKEIADKISQLRNLGYTEEDITLAINSAYKNGKRTKIASRGAQTDQAFENFSQNSDKIISEILSAEIPGIEKGVKHVHEVASDLYGQVAKEGSKLTITNSKPFLDASRKVVDQLQNTLGKNPDAQSFIKRISEAAVDATQYPSAEKMMNFYKELNSMGNWLGRSQKDHLISQLKEGVKETFKSEGKAGRELAKKFEEANKGIQQAYKAQDVHDLIQKVTSQNGIDYKRFNKIFDKKENVQLFKDVLGPEQTKNIKMIGKIGSEVKDFDKAWKVANAFKAGTPTDIVRSGLGMYYIYQGDWEGLAKVAATKLGSAAIRKVAEKSLTDPKFQNLLIRGLHAVKVESPKLMKSANEGMKRYLEEEGIDLEDI